MMTPEELQRVVDQGGGYVSVALASGMVWEHPVFDALIGPNGFWYLEPGAQWDNGAHLVKGECRWGTVSLLVTTPEGLFSLQSLLDGLDGDLDDLARAREAHRVDLALENDKQREFRARCRANGLQDLSS